MSIDRFEKIRQYFHCNDNSKNVQSSDSNYDKLYKVRSVVDSVLKKYRQLPQKKCTMHRLTNHTHQKVFKHKTVSSKQA